VSEGPGPSVVRRRVVVTGRVHGVGFRMSCVRRARELGLAGTVSNRTDGTVEAVFEGDPASVSAMVAWCRHGPALAQVGTVVVHDEPPTGAAGFAVV
jgi:acylphosphatase